MGSYNADKSQLTVKVNGMTETGPELRRLRVHYCSAVASDGRCRYVVDLAHLLLRLFQVSLQS